MANDPNRKRPPFKPKKRITEQRCGGCGRLIPEKEFIRHASRCDRNRQ